MHNPQEIFMAAQNYNANFIYAIIYAIIMHKHSRRLTRHLKIRINEKECVSYRKQRIAGPVCRDGVHDWSAASYRDWCAEPMCRAWWWLDHQHLTQAGRGIPGLRHARTPSHDSPSTRTNTAILSCLLLWQLILIKFPTVQTMSINFYYLSLALTSSHHHQTALELLLQ